MDKIVTFTLDKGVGEQDLIDLSMQNIAHEIEAEAEEYFRGNKNSESYEVVIRIEKKLTQQDINNLPDYNG